MSKIAIVGLACEYPDASTPEEIWNNVLSKRRSFRKIPKNRLPLEDYFSEDPETPDKIYSSNAAVIEGYEFDRNKFKVSGSAYRSTDLTHWLALDVATRALEDAGYLKERNLPTKRTGVIVGNTLTGEFSRSEVMRLRWPYVQRVINEVAVSEGWNEEKIKGFIEKTEKNYKEAFAQVTEDTLAGGLSNTIAGRICNFYDFKGGGYTIDGACSSSLLSVSQGCSALLNNDIDIAIVGGVDLSLDPFELIGFSKTKALAKSEMKIYDKKSNGFWPGEGCGFAVLMRYEDAVKQGHRIYATVNGWGISSDGQGGLTRPEVVGQTLALERAYQSADYSISDVEYFEGHGTGTPVGDKVELTTIKNARQKADANAKPAYISSIKGNIGHTKAAAGIAGFIKVAMALFNRVIPPVSSNDEPNEIVDQEDSQLRLTSRALPWGSTSSLKAGVSSMGFGGINVHITLESNEKEGKTSLSPKEQFISSSYHDSELFLFSGETLEKLEQILRDVSSYAALLSYAELSSLANDLYKGNLSSPFKAAIVAGSPKELTDKLKLLISWIDSGEQRKLSLNQGIYLGKSGKVNIGFLFPGQGAPVQIGAPAYTNRFKFVEDFYTKYPEKYVGDLKITYNAQPNIVKSSIAGLKLLEMLNIKGDIGLGHSLGELTALHWSKILDEEEVVNLAKVRGDAMATASSDESGMASILAGHDEVERLLTGDVTISGFNSKNQTVISGAKGSIEQVVIKAKQLGLVASVLPVSHGFHSKYMELGKKKLKPFLEKLSAEKFNNKVISSVTGELLEDPNLLKELLINQLTEPVHFVKAMETLKDVKLDFLIEVGPGTILSKIAGDELNIPAISLQTNSNSLRGLLNCAALSFVLNEETDLTELFNRYIRRSKSVDKMRFFTNPCESVERKPYELSSNLIGSAQHEVAATKEIIVEKRMLDTNTKDDTLHILKTLLAEKIELPVELIKDDNRMLDDLHLNSITVGQIVAQVSNILNIDSPLAMTEYANATVQEVADILQKQGENNNDPGSISIIKGVEDWVGAFHVDRIVTPSRNTSIKIIDLKRNWHVFMEKEHPLYEHFKTNFEMLNGSGVVVALSPEPNISQVHLLLEAARKSSELQIPFVLIQHDWKTSSAFAKTFYLENGIGTKVINLPLKKEVVSFIEMELHQIIGFEECFYDSQGTRTVPVLSPIELNGKKSMKLSNEDVLLFTGGGKGIALECALSIAKDTGAKLALIGRSNPESDKELRANLERAEALGISFAYKIADVTDSTAVFNAIKSIQSELGLITGFTHAAGINNPKPLHYITMEDFETTIDIKLVGALNVLECLDLDNLKFFVSFSSVIGRSGLQGESHYGLANEWLTSLTENFNDNNLNSKCLSIEWSVWSGTGMGQDLGTIDTLKKQGITPIPLNKGIQFFKSLVYDLLNQDLPTNTVVVTGRMGDIPTLKYAKSQLPILRFVEDIRVDFPGHEIISDVHLTKKNDSYLLDHELEGDLLLPAVLGLEAMAQVTSVMAMTNQRPEFLNITFNHPIIINAEGTTIRIIATKIEKGTFKVTILSETTGFNTPHFEAICRYGFQMPEVEIPSIEFNSGKKNSVEPSRDMYNKFLFQKGRFAQVKHYLRVTSRESLACLKSADGSNWFQDYLPQTLLLGDPGVTDSAIHSLQACIPHKTLIPMSVSKIYYFGDGVSNQEKWVFGKVVKQEDDIHTYNLFIFDQDEQIQECWLGLKLKEVKDTHDAFEPGPLLSAFVERKFRDSLNLSDFSIVLDKFNRKDKSNKEEVLYQLSGKTQSVFRRKNGSPVVEKTEISFSDNGHYVLGIIGNNKVSCDIEQISYEISISEWKKMLGGYFELAQEISYRKKEHISVSCTRLWTVIECIKKSGTSSDQLSSLIKIEKEEVYFKVASFKIGTFYYEDFILTILVEEQLA
jgi:enediyne polyketide synthase